MIPSDQNTFTDQDFLDMLNEEIQYFGVPHLMRTYEEYLIVSEDVELSEDVREYQIPYRAIGNKLRELSFITNVADTNDINNEQVYELSRISVEDLPDFNNYFGSKYTNSFYVKNNKIVLLGEFPLTDAALRMHFYLRPNCLVDEDRAGLIQSIDRVGGVITVESFPNAFSIVPDMDFVNAKSPNNILAYDKTPSSVNSVTRTITFDPDDIPSDLAVGDYINVAQETVVPQLPVELHAVLAQRVAVAALEALGDEQGLRAAQMRLEQMEKSTNTIIDNRVEGAPEKINNRHGSLRSSVIGRYGRSGGKL